VKRATTSTQFASWRKSPTRLIAAISACMVCADAPHPLLGVIALFHAHAIMRPLGSSTPHQ
jgi:hypothetical protein